MQVSEMLTAEMQVTDAQRTKSKIVSLLLTLAMAVVLSVCLSAKAYAASSETSIDIADLTADITTFTNWNYSHAYPRTLTIYQNVNIFDVATATVGDDTLIILLDNSSATPNVTWTADYIADSTFGTDLIKLEGEGSFTVTGGTISTENSSATTIMINSSDVSTYIAGGIVSSGAGFAIDCSVALVTLELSGGTVRTATGRALSLPYVHMAGGTVEATGTGGEAFVGYEFSIAGGIVRATTGHAIHANYVHVGYGFQVTVSNSGPDPAILLEGTGSALEVSGGEIVVTGDVELTNSSSWIEVHSNISNTPGSLFVNGNVNAADWGFKVYEDSSLSIDGNINTASSAIEASDGAVVTVGTSTVPASITAGDRGIVANGSGSTVVVFGDIDAQGFVIQAENGANVEANGDITSPITGVYASDPGTTVTVNGKIDTGHIGIEAHDSATVTATGNIKSGSHGIHALSFSTVKLTGNIIADSQFGILATGSSVVDLLGNITVSGPLAEAGAASVDSAKVTIDGTITAPNYLAFYNPTTSQFYYVTALDYDASSSKPGFLQYTGGNPLSWIWVRGDASALPRAGDNVGIWVLAIVTLLSLAGTTLMLTRRRAHR